jgi:hypothetical protein
MFRTGLVFFLLLQASACTWVKVTEPGQRVEVRQAGETENCKLLGKVTSVSRAKIAGVSRSVKKLATELETIARNEAVDMGGNTVVPAGEINGDEREFQVYQCQ